jgi:CBS domain-containing protein
MRCEEIMKRDVACLSPQDTVQSAAKRMRDENVGFLPVCDSAKKVLGTVTDRDLTVRVLAHARPVTTAVNDVLTPEVIACRPDDELRKAEDLMSKHRKSRIMCVDRTGRLVGVISLSDIAQRESGVRVARTLRDVSEREARA